MVILSLLTLLGGLVLFLHGMQLMSAGIQHLSGGKLESTLERLTASPFRGFLLGVGVTAVIQSSSATTVMVIGFINAGMMNLHQGVGIIMGSKIGTTVTGWLLSLTGVGGEQLWTKLINPTVFMPLFATFGMAAIMFSKHSRRKYIGNILVGFFMLLFGMTTMSGAMEPIAQTESFTSLLTLFSNPFLGMLAGIVITAVVQSSSASVGILQALTLAGSIDFATALPIIIGENIGACVPVLLAGIGTKKEAQRASVMYLIISVAGAAVLMPLYYILDAIFSFGLGSVLMNPVRIAIVHTLFNIISTAFLFPLRGGLTKITVLLVKDNSTDTTSQRLDERFLKTPSYAIEQCRLSTSDMAVLAESTMSMALDSLSKTTDEKRLDTVAKNENLLDGYEDKLSTYMVKLSSTELSEHDSNEVSKLLHIIGDWERIGDHALNLEESAQELREKGLSFSDDAKKELDVLFASLKETVTITARAFCESSTELARLVEPLEEVIDDLKSDLRMRHIARLKRGHCTIELGFIFSDILTNCERVSDHCSNIAACLILLDTPSFNAHAYVHDMTAGADFKAQYEEMRRKYTLPDLNLKG